MPSVPHFSPADLPKAAVTPSGYREDQAARHLAQNNRAARTVAGRARDTQDCRLLLAILGLEAIDAKPQDPAVVR